MPGYKWILSDATYFLEEFDMDNDALSETTGVTCRLVVKLKLVFDKHCKAENEKVVWLYISYTLGGYEWGGYKERNKWSKIDFTK